MKKLPIPPNLRLACACVLTVSSALAILAQAATYNDTQLSVLQRIAVLLGAGGGGAAYNDTPVTVLQRIETQLESGGVPASGGNGAFTGSFTGDGSGLTGVVLTTAANQTIAGNMTVTATGSTATSSLTLLPDSIDSRVTETAALAPFSSVTQDFNGIVGVASDSNGNTSSATLSTGGNVTLNSYHYLTPNGGTRLTLSPTAVSLNASNTTLSGNVTINGTTTTNALTLTNGNITDSNGPVTVSDTLRVTQGSTFEGDAVFHGGAAYAKAYAGEFATDLNGPVPALGGWRSMAYLDWFGGSLLSGWVFATENPFGDNGSGPEQLTFTDTAVITSLASANSVKLRIGFCAWDSYEPLTDASPVLEIDQLGVTTFGNSVVTGALSAGALSASGISPTMPRSVASRSWFVLEEFMNGTSGMSGGWAATNAGGATAATSVSASTEFGLLGLSTGTTASVSQRSGVATNLTSVIVGGNRTLSFVMRIAPGTNANGTDTGWLVGGFGTVVSSVDTSCIEWRSTNGGNWTAVTSSAGNSTTTDSLLAATTGTYRTLGILVNAAGNQVRFTSGNTVVATHTTNIPTVAMGQRIICMRSAATSANLTATLDFAGFGYDLGTATPRWLATP